MRRFRLAVLVFPLLLAPVPAEAGLGTLVKAAAKAGKLAGKAGKGAGAAAKAGKVAKVGGALGGVAVAERAAVGLAALPDDLGRAAAFVAREGDGLSMVRPGGASAVVDDLGRLGDDLGQVEVVVLDPTAAVAPEQLTGLGGRRVFAMDADGAVHPARQDADGDWVVDLVQEGAELSLELGDFAAEQLAVEEEAEEAGLSDEPPAWFYVLIVGGVVGLGVREWRKKTVRLPAESGGESEG